MFRKIEESVSPVQALRDQINKPGKASDKHAEISAMPSSDVIPAICDILSNLQTQLNNSHKHTALMVDKLLAHFRLRHEMANQSYVGALMRMRTMSKDEIYADLDSIKKGLGQIKLTDQTRPLWKELSIWLEGLHLRTYNRCPKEADGVTPMRDNDGNFPTIDYTDSAIKHVTGMTKMGLCEHYHAASANINQSLMQKNQNKNKIPQSLFVAREMDASISAEQMARSAFGQNRN